MKKICFVSHLAYGALAGGSAGHPGGVERQTSLMAQWFAARGFEVSMLTWDEGQAQDVVIGGVRVVKMCAESDGIKWLRFFHPRWTSLNSALASADADVYYQNCAEYVTGQVALWCRRHHRSFVYSVASDPECDPRLPALKTIRERVLYRHGIKNADKVIVQTLAQQSMLRDGFGVDSLPIPMPCPGPSNEEYVPPVAPKERPRVLWVGRLTAVKRFDWLLAVAESLPDVQFDVAGPIIQNDTDKIGFELLRRAEDLSNVTLHGHVSRNRMPEFYKNASLLLCTSEYEGFPNVFLEAWSHGLPLVSTVNPDNLIHKRGLGLTADSKPEICLAIRRIFDDPVLWKSYSKSARAYYTENHRFEPVMEKFEHVFLNLLSPGTSVRRAKRVAGTLDQNS